MPLPLKTLREVSVDLGISETELKTLVNLQKIRSVMKKGKLMFAPDEIAKIRRVRKTLPESVIRSSSAEVASQAPPPQPNRTPPPRRSPRPAP